MGRLKLQAGINAIEEEPEDCDATYSNKATVACMINSEIGSVLAVMRRNVRWGGRFM
jgi:brefeldin A-resistance guanine nucleotide exchange factor 1